MHLLSSPLGKGGQGGDFLLSFPRTASGIFDRREASKTKVSCTAAPRLRRRQSPQLRTTSDRRIKTLLSTPLGGEGWGKGGFLYASGVLVRLRRIHGKNVGSAIYPSSGGPRRPATGRNLENSRSALSPEFIPAQAGGMASHANSYERIKVVDLRKKEW
jgi:hypothetical protein